MPGKASSKKDFVQTDDEAKLLLSVTYQYKVQKLETVDWESVKSKYDDILTKVRKELPNTEKEVKSFQKNYLHTRRNSPKPS